MITRFAIVDGVAVRFKGAMSGMGLEDLDMTAEFDVPDVCVELAKFHVNFNSNENAAIAGYSAPMITPDRDLALLPNISIGSMFLAALAAAFSIADEELAGDRNDYQTHVSCPTEPYDDANDPEVVRDEDYAAAEIEAQRQDDLDAVRKSVDPTDYD